MNCPNCGERDQCVNELDSSISCTICGTVIEDPYLISHDNNIVHRRGKSVEDRKYIAEEWFERASTYYGLGPEIIDSGKELLNKHRLAFPKLSYKEVSVGIICFISKFMKPTWEFDDYIASFPYTLHKPSVIKSFQIVGGQKQAWAESTSNQLDYTLGKIYQLIVKQLFPKAVVPDTFNLESLKSYTKKLLKVGEYYDLNAEKKSRPLITATACLCALHLRTKSPPKRTRKKARVTKPLKEEFYYNWDFQPFSLIVFGSHKYIKKMYTLYYSLLSQCVKKFSWVKLSDPRDAIFHLDDILNLFSPQKDKLEPIMKLDRKQFFPISYVKSLAKTETLAGYLKDAKQHISKDTKPEDSYSLTASIYNLLVAGYDENDFLNWTPGYMRSVCDMVDFRSNYSLGEGANKDLDRLLVNEDDMSNQEVNVYLINDI